MSYIIVDSPGPISEEQVKDVEAQLHITLPEDYRRFLIHYNGGYPEPDVFPLTMEGSEPNLEVVQQFLGIHTESDSIQEHLETYKNRIPEDLLPIAYDPGGNLILIGVSEQNRGQIYFWDHDNEVEEDEIPDYSNVYHVAQTFLDFMRSLRALQDGNNL